MQNKYADKDYCKHRINEINELINEASWWKDKDIQSFSKMELLTIISCLCELRLFIQSEVVNQTLYNYLVDEMKSDNDNYNHFKGVINCETSK